MALRLRRRDTGSPPNALIASAARVNLATTRRPKIGSAGWQKEAWRCYDTVGELRYACSWLANAVSRARLFVADVDDTGRIATTPTERLDGANDWTERTICSAAPARRANCWPRSRCT